jgi:hypothetical protein
LLQATFIRGKPNPRKVPACLNFFSLELWNQSRPEWFEANVGLGSMSLILLHHLLFHLDLRLDGGVLWRKSHAGIQIRCDVAMRRHYE